MAENITYHDLPDVEWLTPNLRFVRTILPTRFQASGRAGWLETTGPGPYRKFDVYLNRSEGDVLSLYEPSMDRCWTRKHDDLPVMEQLHLVALAALEGREPK